MVLEGRNIVKIQKCFQAKPLLQFQQLAISNNDVLVMSNIIHPFFEFCSSLSAQENNNKTEENVWRQDSLQQPRSLHWILFVFVERVPM